MGWLARRPHDPDRLAALEILCHVLQRTHADIARGCQLLYRFRAKVKSDDLMAAKPQSLGHVAAHLPKTNQSQLHVTLPSNLITKLPALASRGAKHPHR